jgi:ABC-type transport system substrate-binding protein
MIDLWATQTGRNRRDFLKSSVAVAASVYAMRWGGALAADIPLEFDGSKFQLTAAEPNPKHGGLTRMGIPARPPHFDLHQSGTIYNLGAMGCMFDNLVRRDPRDGGKTSSRTWHTAGRSPRYTFFLRQRVQFSDGAELTADDVKVTFDQIAKPPQGITIPRSILFKAVNEINARDKYTVEFKLSEARPVNFMMSALASGFADDVPRRDRLPTDCSRRFIRQAARSERSLRLWSGVPPGIQTLTPHPAWPER